MRIISARICFSAADPVGCYRVAFNVLGCLHDNLSETPSPWVAPLGEVGDILETNG